DKTYTRARALSAPSGAPAAPHAQRFCTQLTHESLDFRRRCFDFGLVATARHKLHTWTIFAIVGIAPDRQRLMLALDPFESFCDAAFGQPGLYGRRMDDGPSFQAGFDRIEHGAHDH